MNEYLLGLDWIDGDEGWAYCQLFTGQTAEPVKVGVLATTEQQSSFVKDAARIIVDAPIGLRASGKNTVAEDRPCDKGAKRWIGSGRDLGGTVMSPPYQSELVKWRQNRLDGVTGEGGHIRGLLPAIDAAEQIVAANANTLESHPELVFAFLLGKTLLAEAAKATLLGAMVRLGILAANGLRVSLGQLVVDGRVATNNFIDALALAVVARDWHRQGEVQVIRTETGNLEPLGPDPASRSMLMAVPHVPSASMPLPRSTRTELLSCADNWMKGAVRDSAQGAAPAAGTEEQPQPPRGTP